MGLGIDSPISVIAGGTTGYYHTDGLGTVREITSSTGSILNSYTYDAWGNIESSSETVTQPFTFTAREWDSDSSLYYYRARYMDAAVGRFTTMDPALGDADDPASFHGYGYVGNNPVNYVDPSGAVFEWAPILGTVESAIRTYVRGVNYLGMDAEDYSGCAGCNPDCSNCIDSLSLQYTLSLSKQDAVRVGLDVFANVLGFIPSLSIPIKITTAIDALASGAIYTIGGQKIRNTATFAKTEYCKP